jgi:protein-S-isoprenylcysteine O-methyltransferase Ste14
MLSSARCSRRGIAHDTPSITSFLAGRYAIFFATFLYLIAFVGDLPIAAQTVDSGLDAPLATAVLIDVALIALFGLQHSVMARQGFKRAWTRMVPEHLERSTMSLPQARR